MRERKKLRTRATLIDAAADLCLAQGYDNTTVEQIAAAADVSPRTFSRYFPTKESVVAAITDDLDELIADALDAAARRHHRVRGAARAPRWRSSAPERRRDRRASAGWRC